MTKVIRHIDDIPIDIYTQIPIVVYDEYKNILRELTRYADKLVTNKIEKPLKGITITKKYGRSKYFIYKSEDDPFDVEYCIMCRIQTIKINEILSAFLKKKNLEFDLQQFVDRDILLSDIAKEFNQMLNKKVSIKYDFGYIKIIAHVLFDVEDKVITI